MDSVRGGLLFLVVGLGVAGFGVYDYVQQSEAVENSVEVEATITETGIESVSTGSSTGVDYKPRVAFGYSYQGESYTGDNVFPSSVTPNYDTRSAAESVLDGYEEGDTVTAYATPDSPSSAFLKDEESNSPLLLTAIGVLFVLGGGTSAFRSHRSS